MASPSGIPPEKDSSWGVHQDPSLRISVLEERIRGMEAAKLLQATEYERRLEVLNHAHEEAKRVLGTYVQITIYNEFLRGYQEWKAKLDIEHSGVLSRLQALEVISGATTKRIDALETTNTERGGRSKTFVGIVAALAVVATGISILTALASWFRP